MKRRARQLIGRLKRPHSAPQAPPEPGAAAAADTGNSRKRTRKGSRDASRSHDRPLAGTARDASFDAVSPQRAWESEVQSADALWQERLLASNMVQLPPGVAVPKGTAVLIHPSAPGVEGGEGSVKKDAGRDGDTVTVRLKLMARGFKVTRKHLAVEASWLGRAAGTELKRRADEEECVASRAAKRSTARAAASASLPGQVPTGNDEAARPSPRRTPQPTAARSSRGASNAQLAPVAASSDGASCSSRGLDGHDEWFVPGEDDAPPGNSGGGAPSATGPSPAAASRSPDAGSEALAGPRIRTVPVLRLGDLSYRVSVQHTACQPETSVGRFRGTRCRN